MSAAVREKTATRVALSDEVDVSDPVRKTRVMF